MPPTYYLYIPINKYINITIEIEYVYTFCIIIQIITHKNTNNKICEMISNKGNIILYSIHRHVCTGDCAYNKIIII